MEDNLNPNQNGGGSRAGTTMSTGNQTLEDYINVEEERGYGDALDLKHIRKEPSQEDKDKDKEIEDECFKFIQKLKVLFDGMEGFVEVEKYFDKLKKIKMNFSTLEGTLLKGNEEKRALELQAEEDKKKITDLKNKLETCEQKLKTAQNEYESMKIRVKNAINFTFTSNGASSGGTKRKKLKEDCLEDSDSDLLLQTSQSGSTQTDSSIMFFCRDPNCKKVFTRQAGLKQHEAMIHGIFPAKSERKGFVPQICPYCDCGVQYGSKRRLEEHKKALEELDVVKPFKCPLCNDFKAAIKWNLADHMKNCCKEGKKEASTSTTP